MSEQPENDYYDEIVFNLETTSTIDCNGFPANKIDLEESTATEERKSSDDEASENLNKNIIEEKAKDNQQILFVCQKKIKDVNINSNKTPIQEEKKTPENISISLNSLKKEQYNLVQNGKLFNSYKVDYYIRVDNLRREAFFAPMKLMEIFLRGRYKLRIKRIKCKKVLGITIQKMKSSFKLTIQEILCENKINEKIIEEKFKSGMNSTEKSGFTYFMNMKYEELFSRYITGGISFPFFKEGTVRISNFITLEKAIPIKEKKWRKLKAYKNNEEKLKKKTEKFIKISRNMIDDINGRILERKGNKNKKFKTLGKKRKK